MTKQNSPYKLKIHTLNDSWHDSDELLLHGCFQILVNFIENEKPAETVDWKGSGDGAFEAWREMQSLYRWWKEERAMRKDVEYDMPDDYIIVAEDGAVTFNDEKYPHVNRYILEQSALDQSWYQEDSDNLHRLVNVRQWMWT